MKIFVINHTQIFVDLASVCFWIWIADKRLRFLQTKHLQCIYSSKMSQKRQKSVSRQLSLQAYFQQISKMRISNQRIKKQKIGSIGVYRIGSI